MNILKRTLAGLLVVYLAFGQVTVIPGDWVQGFSSLTTAGSNVYVTGAGTIGQDTSFTRSAAGRYTLYDTTATTGVTTFTVRAGAGQSSTNLLSIFANDGTTNRFSVDGSGNAVAAGYLQTLSNLFIANSSALIFNSRSVIASAADGQMNIRNNAGTGFTRLQFGSTTNSFAAIGFDAVNGFTIQSAAGTATYNDASTSASGTVANRYLWGIAAPTLTATNASTVNTVASTVYIGGAPTASTNVTIGTAYALNVAAGNSLFGGSITVGNDANTVGLYLSGGSSSAIRHTGASGGTVLFDVGTSGATHGAYVWRSSNGYTERMRLTTTGMLTFGGTTSAVPALKANSTTLQVRLADDSADATLQTGTLIVGTQTPASASATGTAGTITWDSSYIYICTATNTWKRVAIATW